jgi:hypothetical protein
MADGDWSDYVAGAGSDPEALSGAADAMGGAIEDASPAGASPALESIDATALPADVAGGVEAAQYDTSEAASWERWSQGDLANAASWQNQAAGDVESAREWAAFGNPDAAQQELDAAATASDIGAAVAGGAATDLGIGAGYLDSAATELSSAADTTASDSDA